MVVIIVGGAVVVMIVGGRERGSGCCGAGEYNVESGSRCKGCGGSCFFYLNCWIVIHVFIGRGWCYFSCWCCCLLHRIVIVIIYFQNVVVLSILVGCH